MNVAPGSGALPAGPSPPPGLSLVPRDGWRPLPKTAEGGWRIRKLPERDRSLSPLPLAGEGASLGERVRAPAGASEMPVAEP